MFARFDACLIVVGAALFTSSAFAQQRFDPPYFNSEPIGFHSPIQQNSLAIPVSVQAAMGKQAATPTETVNSPTAAATTARSPAPRNVSGIPTSLPPMVGKNSAVQNKPNKPQAATPIQSSAPTQGNALAIPASIQAAMGQKFEVRNEPFQSHTAAPIETQAPAQAKGLADASVIPTTSGWKNAIQSALFEARVTDKLVVQGCDECGQPECCCPPKKKCFTIGGFGEFLYLRPRDADVAYAVPFNGPIGANAIPIQTGAIGVIDPRENSAYRVGALLGCGACDTLSASYTSFESSVSEGITTGPSLVVRPMTVHPETIDAATDGLFADAQLDIDFELVDADFRRIFSRSECYQYSWLLGVRYAQLNQEFASIFGDNGIDTVVTDVDFDGVGLRLGLAGEHLLAHRSLFLYAQGQASFLTGEFDAAFAQGSNFDASVVDTGWEAGRIVTQLDLEVGIGWRHQCDCIRVSAGYVFSGWFNVVTTEDWIQAVQANDFSDLGSTMSFDGLVVRLEVRI